MSLIIKGQAKSSFTPHPVHSGPVSCIDVQDLGWQENKKYEKWEYKIRLVFWAGLWTEPKMIDGEERVFPALVMQKFTASLGDKANLRKFCKDWRGEDFSPEVLKDGFDFEKMFMAPGWGQITHSLPNDNGDVYANISMIKLAAAMGEAPGMPDGYVRLKDRDDWEGPAPHPNMSTSEPDLPPVIENPEDDGLPF